MAQQPGERREPGKDKYHDRHFSLLSIAPATVGMAMVGLGLMSGGRRRWLTLTLAVVEAVGLACERPAKEPFDRQRALLGAVGEQLAECPGFARRLRLDLLLHPPFAFDTAEFPLANLGRARFVEPVPVTLAADGVAVLAEPAQSLDRRGLLAAIGFQLLREA